MSFAGGKLKLKGGLGVKAASLKKKARKQKSKKIVPVDGDEEDTDPKEKRQEDDLGSDEFTTGDGVKETPEGYHLPPRRDDEDKRTAAERKYDEWLKRREEAQVGALAAKSHRARIREFNEYLANLTEHHDIPKVGPG